MRNLNQGSHTEIADWLRGINVPPNSEDAGLLAHIALAQGQLMWAPDDADPIWTALSDSDLYAIIKRFDGANWVTPDGKTRVLAMNPRLAKSVQSALELDADAGTSWCPARGVTFQNGFLRIERSGAFQFGPLTREHQATRRLPWDFDPRATHAPHFKTFLESLWGAAGDLQEGATELGSATDFESIRLCLQMIGYCLAGDQSRQKAFLLLGPPRSGKGTLTWILEQLIGTGKTGVQPFKLTALDDSFALEHIAHASVIVDSDFRRGRGHMKDESVAVERILSITAGDPQDINRKGLKRVRQVLPGRIIICANPPFQIRDVGAALASRFTVLPFHRSYLGKEDLELKNKLAPELPAIANMALAAFAAMGAQGQFVEPASAAEMREEIEIGQSPLTEFFDEYCQFDADAEISCERLYKCMREWAEANGNSPPSNQSFASALKQRRVFKIHHRTEGQRQPRVYQGVKLKPYSPLKEQTSGQGQNKGAKVIQFSAPRAGKSDSGPATPSGSAS